MVEKKLLEILVCPECHSKVSEIDDEIACNSCPLAFPIRSGIPIMLLSDARRRG
jgi:uncharacterized protein YbaR (Trm112 family)